MTTIPSAIAGSESVVEVPATPRRTDRRRIQPLVIRWLLRIGMRAYLAGHRLIPVRNRRARTDEMLLTLNFHAPGWPRALLTPAAMSRGCSRVRVVTCATLPAIPNVEAIYPPPWLKRLCGSTIARLVTFSWVALRTRPRVVAGVHLLVNGLVASMIAKLVGARSLYVCVGGPNELAGGGILSENRLFGLQHEDDPVLERLLLDAASTFDLIVTMGSRAAAFFRSRGTTGRLHVIPCGLGEGDAQPLTRDVDVILVARLAPVKRIDLFVEAIRCAAEVEPDIRAVVIGEGGLRSSLEETARRLGIDRNVEFLGHQPDVMSWLRRARVFLLTSETEGVSISLLEAMQSGAVPVVANVGDLADVVVDGINGFLIDDRSPRPFADRVVELLRSPELAARLAARARETARAHAFASIAAKWDAALSEDAAAPRRREQGER